MVAFIVDIVGGAVVCEVEIVCCGRILGGEGVNLLHHWQDAEFFTARADGAHAEVGVFVEHLFVYRACNLEVAESLLLCKAEERLGYVVGVVELFELCRCVDYIVELVEEPTVDFCELVYAVYGVAVCHGFGNGKNSAVGGFAQSSVEVVD